MRFPKALHLVGALVALTLTCGVTRANDVYIAQSAAGTANGADCADAKAASFFNTISNWGTGAGQIGAGTTVHLCGTNTASGRHDIFDLPVERNAWESDYPQVRARGNPTSPLSGGVPKRKRLWWRYQYVRTQQRDSGRRN